MSSKMPSKEEIAFQALETSKTTIYLYENIAAELQRVILSGGNKIINAHIDQAAFDACFMAGGGHPTKRNCLKSRKWVSRRNAVAKLLREAIVVDLREVAVDAWYDTLVDLAEKSTASKKKMKKVKK